MLYNNIVLVLSFPYCNYSCECNDIEKIWKRHFIKKLNNEKRKEKKMAEENKNLFERLSEINVNERTENKNGLTYLSWAWAVSEISKICPDFTYDIEPYTYDENLGYMVYTHITINGITKRMWLPVMNHDNRAMKKDAYQWKDKYGKLHDVNAASMTDINKAYMRCLTKNISMFGLGMYIYAGEDLPETEETKKIKKATASQIEIIKNNVEKVKSLLKDLEITKPSELKKLTLEQASHLCKIIDEGK